MTRSGDPPADSSRWPWTCSGSRRAEHLLAKVLRQVLTMMLVSYEGMLIPLHKTQRTGVCLVYCKPDLSGTCASTWQVWRVLTDYERLAEFRAQPGALRAAAPGAQRPCSVATGAPPLIPSAPALAVSHVPTIMPSAQHLLACCVCPVNCYLRCSTDGFDCERARCGRSASVIAACRGGAARARLWRLAAEAVLEGVRSARRAGRPGAALSHD